MATCRTTTLVSGAAADLEIAVSGGEPPRGVEVNALLIPLAAAPTGAALPEGTVRAATVARTGEIGAAIVYTAAFAVPSGCAGDYQLVLDWRHGVNDGEYIVVGNDDPRSIFHVDPPTA